MPPDEKPPEAPAKPAPTTDTGRKLAILSTEMERRMEFFQAICANELDPRRLFKVTLSAIARDTKLLNSSPASLLDAMMRAAELGLEPTGSLGGAYLVPFKNAQGTYIATLIIGYRGFIDLARRSGKVSKIEAHCIHEHDLFKHAKGLEPTLIHEPKFPGDRGKVIGAYSWALLSDGSKQYELMDLDQLEAIRKRAKSSRNPSAPWTTDTEEMYRKTVVRRLVKYLPLSAEAEKAIDEDDRADFEQGTTDVSPAPEGPKTTRTEDLKSRLKPIAAKPKTNDAAEDAEWVAEAGEPPADDVPPPEAQ